MNEYKKITIKPNASVYVSLSDFNNEDVINYAASISLRHFINPQLVWEVAVAAHEARRQKNDTTELELCRAIVSELTGLNFNETPDPSPTSAEPP